MCELICGGFMLYFFDKRYWYYKDPYSYFNGLISLYFIPHWFILGFMINILRENNIIYYYE
jgi:hypothetical protein